MFFAPPPRLKTSLLNNAHLLITSPVLLALVSCGAGDNSVHSSSATADTHSVNQLGSAYVVSESTLAEKSARMAVGEYFIAPPVEYSTLGTIDSPDDTRINDDGHNYLALTNVFSTEIRNLKLGLYYNSNNSLDRFNNIVGSWRTSYNSYMDFAVDYQGAGIRSGTYASARDACEAGFDDIKDSLYRGLLATANTLYDDSREHCVVRLDGEDVGTFPVWNISGGIVGNYHYLSKPSGEVLIFEQDGQQYVANDRGIQVTMQVLDDGRYEYIDADGAVYIYSTAGQLQTINFEGQITTLTYDEQAKVVAVVGPLENRLTFAYNSDQTLASVSSADKKLVLTYNSSALLTRLDLITDETLLDEDYDFDNCAENCLELNDDGSVKTNPDDLADADVQTGLANENSSDTVNIASLDYNSNGLLSRFSRQAWQDEDDAEQIIEQEQIDFGYDSLNRVIHVTSLTGGNTDITYEPTVVTRSFDTGNQVVRHLSYKGSRQQVQLADDAEAILAGEYNTNGQLTRLTLEPDTNTTNDNNVAAQSSTSSRLDMAFAYDTRGLLARVEYETVATGKRFVQMEYGTRYPKPTKVLTDDEVTFFDIDQNGQLIRRTSVRFDKDMKLRAASVSQDEVRQHGSRRDVAYEYDESGFLARTTNLVSNEGTDYEVDADGVVGKKVRLRENGFNFISWLAWYFNERRSGWTPQTGDIDVTKDNVQTVWVSGFMDDDEDPIPTLAANSGHKDGYDNYHTWFDLDRALIGGDLPLETDPFGKRRDKLVVVGYSWGGDSAVEASQTATDGNNVDLLITIDPIGIGDYTSGASHWIMVYAMAGRPLGGYMYMHKATKTISIPYWGCSRKGWRIRCGWKHKKIAVPYWYPAWQDTMGWNESDWIAFVGGKGTFSSYDHARPDQKIEITAHHGDSGYLVWALEHGRNHRTNNEFKLNSNAGVRPDDSIYTGRENRYSRYHTDYGVTFWK
jgi:YD repeat-containing protein